MSGQSIDLSLYEIFFCLRKNLNKLFHSAYLGAALGFVAALGIFFFHEVFPSYSAAASLAVNAKTINGRYSTGDSDPGSQDIYLSVYLRDSISYIAKSNRVYSYVLEHTSMDITFKEYQGCIRVTQYMETPIMEIMVVWKDEEQTLQLIAAIMDVLPIALQETLEIGSVNPVDVTVKTTEQNNRVDLFWLVIGSFMAVAVQGGLIVLKFLLEPTFIQAESVEKHLGMDVLANIEHIDFSRPYSLEQYSRHYTELAYVFDRAAGTQAAKNILVTACAEASGCTTTVAMLAVALAKLGKRVLVVDGNLENPQMGRLFHMTETGPNTTVHGIVACRFFLQKTNSNLPCYLLEKIGGSKAPVLGDSVEALQANSYDYLLIDAPSSESFFDTHAIVPYFDGVLWVLRQNDTPIGKAVSRIEGFKRTGTPMLGCVFNDVWEKRKKAGQNEGDASFEKAGRMDMGNPRGAGPALLPGQRNWGV